MRIAYVYLTEEGGVMKNKFLLIGLLFAVPLFFPFIAYAQSGTSTLSHFTTIDCPPIEVSGKVAFEKDCVQGILDQVHQSYTKEIKAEDAPRAGDEAKQRTELYNKCEEDRVRASDMLSSCTASRDQAKVSLQAMEAQMQELIASRDQAKVSLEEKEAQIQELTASRDQANEALHASQAHNLVLNETRRCTETAFERERRQETGPQISVTRDARLWVEGGRPGSRLCLDGYRFRELFCREE